MLHECLSYRMSQKSGTLDFRYFEIRKNNIFFISSDKTLSSEKNDTKIIKIGWVVLILWSFLKTSSLSIFSSFLWTAIAVVNSSRRLKKNRKWLCCRISTTEPNQIIFVSFFSEDNVLSDDIKICYIFEYYSNTNRAFRFFGTPGIVASCENLKRGVRWFCSDGVTLNGLNGWLIDRSVQLSIMRWLLIRSQNAMDIDGCRQ